MEADGLKSKVVKGVCWTMLTKLSMRLLTFVVTLVLARLLSPSDYGTISLLTIFISVASTFAESGFGKALVQKKDATQLDFNTIFYTSLVLSSCVYGILFVAAPYIAEFYRDPKLTAIMRVLSLNIIAQAVSGVQGAELSRKMRFDVGFKVSCVSHVLSAAAGIALAYLGYGPWAIVWSQMAASVGSIFMLWAFIAWRPKLLFSFASLRELWGFSWKLTLSSLIDTAYRNLYGFLVGRMYSKEDLAFVEKGNALPGLAMDMILGPINGVMYPALAQLQDEKARFLSGMRRMIQVSTFFVFPTLTGLAICARPVTVMMYGEQWLPSIPYVELACFSFALWPMHVINLYAISAQGRSDIYLKLEVIKKILGLTMVLLSIHHGVFCLMAVLAFVNGPLGLIVNAWPNRRLLGYTIGMQLKDVMPVVLACSVMATAVASITFFLKLDSIIGLFIQVPLGVLCYLAVVLICHVKAYEEVVVIAGPLFKKINNRRG